MFVKIARGSHTSLYECLSVRTDYDDDTSTLHMTLEGPAKNADALQIQVCYDVPEALEIYYMNSDGKTIDRVFWKKAGKLD